MLSIVVRFEFDYGHHLPYHEGKCKNPHGHRGIAEIEFVRKSGIMTDDQGMVYDFGDLKKRIKENIIDKYFDHQYLNNFMIHTPTCENIALFMASLLNKEFQQEVVCPVTLKVWETPDSHVIYQF